MIVFFKYKRIPKHRSFQYSFPQKRIAKFKKGKWKFLKKLFTRRAFRRIKFYNFLKVKVRKRRPEKLKPMYRTGLIFKNSYLQFFNYGISLKHLKAFSKEKNRFAAFFIKPFFKLDILLWKLKFFVSVKEAQQYITNSHVLVNGVTSSSIKIVQKGDVITINSLVNCKLNDKRLYSRKSRNFLFAFCEVDYYTKTVVILKDIENFVKKDYTLLYRKYVNDDILYYYLSKQ